MLNIIKRFSTVAIAASLLIPSLTGCIGENSVCPGDIDAGDSKGGVNIKFAIASNHGSRSRAADLDGTQQGTPPEDYIDVSDMQFMLFDSEQRFLRFLNPIVSEQTDGYIATASFEEPTFTAATAGDIQFYILALANGKSMGSTWVGAERGSTTIADVCASAQNSTLTASPVAWQLLGEGSPAARQRFPMAGLQNFTVAVSALKASTEAAPVDLSAGSAGRVLNMLRALAKIEVIDKVNYVGTYDESLAGLPIRLDKVEINGYFTRGNQIPLYSQWSRNVTLPETQQVVSPSIPRSCSYVNPPFFDPNRVDGAFDGTILDFEYDSRATAARSDKAPVFSAYVYEFCNPSEGIVITQPPYIRITTKGDGSSGSSRILSFRLGKYTAGVSDGDYLPEILRNHIYRYEVQGINEFSAEITLNVADWESEETIWDYSEVIGMNDGDEIKWTEGTYQAMNPVPAELILLQNMTPAQCTFTLRSPLTATWRAYFVVESGATVPFNFIDAEGNRVESVSGLIDGNPVNLSITATDATPQQLNRARLMVMVTLPDGRSMNADILNRKYGKNTYFTIIQNPQL